MPRVAITDVRIDPMYTGPNTTMQCMVQVKIFGAGMPADRAVDQSSLAVIVDFERTLTENRQAARVAIIGNVRIDTLEQFFQSL
jgi:hypothetical protein